MGLLNISCPKDRHWEKKKKMKKKERARGPENQFTGFWHGLWREVRECSQGQPGQACNWLTPEYCSGVWMSVRVCVFVLQSVCVCELSQAMSEYCKAKYIAPARLHCFQGADMLPSPRTTVNVDLKYNRHSILFSLGSDAKSSAPFAAIQSRAHQKLGVTAWLSSCLVF